MAAVKLSTKAVGSIVKLKLNSAVTEFIVINQGRPSTLYDTSCDGTWLLMKDVYETRQWHNDNINDYANSTIHSYLNSTFLNLFDVGAKAAIKQVKIPYRPGAGGSMSVNSGSSGLSAKIFLLSGYEMGWTNSDNSYFPVDGARVSYFDAGAGTAANNKRIGYLNGTATRWWLRSPCTNSTSYAWHVSTNGDCNYDGCSSSWGVRPALVLPPTLSVNGDGLVVTNQPPTITCELSGDLGNKEAGFRIPYTVSDADEGDVVTVEEAVDGKVKRNFAAVLGQSNSFDITGDSFQKLLNGSHTLTITATDADGEKAVRTLTFTKAVYACRITMKEPMPSASLITKMVLSVSRSIPDGAGFSVQVTNNGKDDSPVWEDAASSVNSGVNYLFQNTTAVNGSAYNFILTASRKEGGEGGYISFIGGAFEPDKQAGPDYAGTLKVNVAADDGGSWENTRVRVTNNLFGQKFYPLDALGRLTLQLLANQTYTVRLVDIPEKYYSQTQMADIKSQETAALNFTLSTKPDVVGYRIEKATGNVEYIEGAAGMEAARMDFTADKNDPGDWGDHWLFRNIRPCLLKDGEVQYYLNPDDYTKRADGLEADILTGADGDVMVEFPLVYTKEYEDDTYNYCLMCSENWDGSFHADAFTNQNSVVQETMYISAYEVLVGNINKPDATPILLVRNEKTPTVSKTIGEFRTAATNMGPGYQQLEWSKHTLLQNLFVMKYKGLNSQALLGKGNTSSSAALPTGTMNQKGMDWGDQTGTNGVKFCGIEHPWGNPWKFCDGLGVKSNDQIAYKAYAPYNDTLSGYAETGILKTQPGKTSGYISRMKSGAWGKVPVALDGAENTFYGDCCYFNSSSDTRICHVGGNWGHGSTAGLFGVYLDYVASSSGAGIGARLCYTPQ